MLAKELEEHRILCQGLTLRGVDTLNELLSTLGSSQDELSAVIIARNAMMAAGFTKDLARQAKMEKRLFVTNRCLSFEVERTSGDLVTRYVVSEPGW